MESQDAHLRPQLRVIEGAGSIGLSAIIWFLAGLTSLLGIVTYAELGATYTHLNSDYDYVFHFVGPLPGFIRLWCDAFMLRPAIGAINTIAAAYYILTPFYHNCQVPDAAVRLLALFLLFTMTAMNAHRTKNALRFQSVSTIFKVSALVVIIVLGAISFAQGRRENYQNIFEGSNTDVMSVGKGFYAALYGFVGWWYLNTMVQEMFNPKRTMPIASCTGMIMVSTIYVLTILAYHVVLSPEDLLNSNAAAVLFFERTFKPLKYIVPFCVSISALGSANANMLIADRFFFSAAQNGQMNVLFSMIHEERNTPVNSAIAVGILSSLYMTSTDTVKIINYIGIGSWSPTIFVALLLIYLRYKDPNTKRPYKVPIICPILYILLVCSIIIFAFAADTRSNVIGVLCMFASIPIYYLFVVWDKPLYFKRLIMDVTKYSQKLFLVRPCSHQ
ncbi:hypothetical protein SNEBB_007841 [Seison nebaliae]|nr:hypothetical protein SNEBB_007841 [Seison nebaliae]